jgi:hypothetical protein
MYSYVTMGTIVGFGGEAMRLRASMVVTQNLIVVPIV